MSYISHSTYNIPWNHTFPDINRTNFWVLNIGRKEPTTVQQVLEDISSHQLTGKFNRVHVIIAFRKKNISRTNLQENISILNQVRHIQEISNKLIGLTLKKTPDRIGDVFKIPLISDWYDSIFQMMRKWQNPQHLLHHFYVLYYHQIQKYSDPGYILG